jgi:hypothetical protein
MVVDAVDGGLDEGSVFGAEDILEENGRFHIQF